MSELTSHAFPKILKSWRNRRRFSQLELSLEAGLSQRHLSFLETGRSRPSRLAISQLSEALDMPAAEVDVMLLAAGFAARSDSPGWSEGTRMAIEQSINHVLEGHNPYPAIYVDSLWNLKKANTSAEKFFAPFLTDSTPNMLREFLRPGPLRDSIANWPEVARALMRLLELERAHRPHKQGGAELVEELQSFPGVPEAMNTPTREYPAPVLSITFQLSDTTLNFFSLIASIGMTTHAAIDDLRIETLLPADAETREWFAQ